MKSLTLSVMLMLLPAFCVKAGDETGSDKMTKLFECGQNTERGFNGWAVHGLPEHANLYFERDHLEIFQHQGGNYSVGIERKVEELIGFSDILVSLDMQAIENCIIHHTTAYVSTDGKNWDALQTDPRLGAKTYNDQMNSLFIRLIADVQFFQQARFRFNKVSVFGDYSAVKYKAAARAKICKPRATK